MKKLHMSGIQVKKMFKVSFISFSKFLELE
jgi:hypothetical protein